MPKHTPGSWSEAGPSIVSGKGLRIAWIGYGRARGTSMRIPESEQNANAALIAAAPDLLVALEELAAECELGYRRIGGLDADPSVDRANAAIKKAKGE